MKVPNKKCYMVMDMKTDVVHSKCTTLANAKKQVNLLNVIKGKKKM